jgi:hypothetical protein
MCEEFIQEMENLKFGIKAEVSNLSQKYETSYEIPPGRNNEPQNRISECRRVGSLSEA